MKIHKFTTVRRFQGAQFKSISQHKNCEKYILSCKILDIFDSTKHLMSYIEKLYKLCINVGISMNMNKI